jgi:hypothetical protein
LENKNKKKGRRKENAIRSSNTKSFLSLYLSLSFLYFFLSLFLFFPCPFPAQVLGTLGQQRKQLENTKNNLMNADENIGRSGKVIRTMARRMVTNKLIMILIILVLIGTIGLIIYFKYIKGSGKSSSSGSASSAAAASATPSAHPSTEASPDRFLLE